jgi:hypothetical protein
MGPTDVKETDVMHVCALLPLIPETRAAGSRTCECLR